jgi:hypothetical protein
LDPGLRDLLEDLLAGGGEGDRWGKGLKGDMDDEDSEKKEHIEEDERLLYTGDD